jgi:hypothetical protein
MEQININFFHILVTFLTQCIFSTVLFVFLYGTYSTSPNLTTCLSSYTAVAVHLCLKSAPIILHKMT